MGKLLAFFLGFLLIGSGLAAPRPNIILFMADDMGWGDPGYNSRTVTLADGSAHPDRGWISTPTMDAMAASGLRFDRFYAASAVCSPTRASCLTGRNPFRVGVPHANQGRLGFDETPLSEVLAEVGYRCGHFGKWHLGTMTTLRKDSNRGPNASVYSAPWHHRYDAAFCTEAKVPTYHPYRVTRNGAALPTSFTDPNFYGTHYWRMPTTWNDVSGEGAVVPVAEVNDAANGDDSKLLVDQAIPFMQDAVAEEKPFFLVLWFHTPHKPTVDPEGISSIDSADSLKDSIEDLDVALGRVRDELTNLGVRDNTMFWVTSDNGPEDGINSPNESSTVRSIRSGRYLERKRSLHEGGVRVPGILEWPNVITTGESTDVPAVTSDYYPTILDYLDLSVPGQKPLDGISLRPVIEGAATVRSKPIGFKFNGDNSWVNQRYKLIDDGSGWQLYDLVNVPEGQEVEQVSTATAANVASKSEEIQEVYHTMLAEYTAWDRSVSDDLPYVHASQPTVVLSAPPTALEPFPVTATFSEPVTQLHAHEFVVTNGSASDLEGSGVRWTVTVSPTSNGEVTIDLPEGAVIDSEGNPNGASEMLSVSYSDPLTPPGVLLSAPESLVESSFEIEATFTEPVSGLESSDFVVTNGTASEFAGSGVVYTLLITPTTSGEVTISLPAASVNDLNDGLDNTASNRLEIAYSQVGTTPGTRLETALAVTAFQSVDRLGHVPGDRSNNLLKFTAGNINDGVANPFTTDLYVRTSSANAERNVRALVRFDLSSLERIPISFAAIRFLGHALNDQNDVNLELVALNADWRETLPSFEMETVGEVIRGGPVNSDLRASDHTKSYNIDVTTAVSNWLSGTWPNHGFQIRLDSQSTENGVGIQLADAGALQLVIEQTPFVITHVRLAPSASDVLLEWNSAPGKAYRIERSDALSADWESVANVIGSSGGTTRYTDFGGGDEDGRLFYRISFD